MKTMNARTGATTLATCAILLAGGTLQAHAQASTAEQSARWLAFVGCWEPMGVAEDAGLLCFRPAGGGVEMFNVFEGEVTATEAMVADGVARPVSAEGCTGTESVEFSDDGRRVFTSSTFRCEAGETREGTGVMSFISSTEWVDVRSLTVEGEPVAWIQRYAGATAESLRDHDIEDPAAIDRPGVRSRRLLAARDILISDVEEAVRRVDPEAVKIWLATHETEFDLSGSELVRLADSGIPDDVVDVMVAVSYPDQFVVTPEGVPEGVAQRVTRDAYQSGARVGYRSFLWDPFYAPIGYRYGYSPYGYYGSGYGGYYGYSPVSVIVVPREPFQASGGRVINGQGYRGPSSSGGSGGGAAPSGSSDRAPSSTGSGSDDSPSSNSGSGRRASPR
jgi:hypothetical protein